MQTTCEVVLTAGGRVWSELRGDEMRTLRQDSQPFNNADLPFTQWSALLCSSLSSVPCASQPSFIRHSRAGSHFCSTKSRHVCRCLSAPSNHYDKDSAIGSCRKADIFIVLLCGTARGCYRTIITIMIYKFKIYLKLKSADKHIYNAIVKCGVVSFQRQ